MNQKIFLPEKMLDCSTKTCNVSFNLNNYSLVFEKKNQFSQFRDKISGYNALRISRTVSDSLFEKIY